jgi:hypothetical protein
MGWRTCLLACLPEVTGAVALAGLATVFVGWLFATDGAAWLLATAGAVAEVLAEFAAGWAASAGPATRAVAKSAAVKVFNMGILLVFFGASSAIAPSVETGLTTSALNAP